ncbi:E6 [Gammapapillomavirus 7]|uniref:Protein E6 n=1 Tax=Gammapapillomavirus 7 TaxID=1175849 RepID=A0A2D2ALE5_9PAPI|nr:E6 [Gammapapillomavirus 7]
MEPQSCSNVYGLCVLYGCTLETLSVPCLFCKCILSLQDIIAFIIKHLKVVFRSGTFYAACGTCLRLSAAYEQKQYCQCSASPDFVKLMCNGDLTKLNMRCIICMKKLDYIEVLDAFETEVEFLLIRSIWRTRCRLCK